MVTSRREEREPAIPFSFRVTDPISQAVCYLPLHTGRDQNIHGWGVGYYVDGAANVI